MAQTKEEFIERNIKIKQLNNGDFYINSIRCDVRGHVGGSVDGDVFGNVGGSVGGSVRGSVGGSVGGSVYGNVDGNVRQKSYDRLMLAIKLIKETK